jgi:hypothetical protein
MKELPVSPSIEAMVVDNARVMSYEDIVEAQKQCDIQLEKCAWLSAMACAS